MRKEAQARITAADIRLRELDAEQAALDERMKDLMESEVLFANSKILT